jgi:hypothetical protein
MSTANIDKKELSVIDNGPWSIQCFKKYYMLTEQERIDIHTANPEWVVRLADEAEQMDKLSIENKVCAEGTDKKQPIEFDMTDERRMVKYWEVTRLLDALSMKFRVLANNDLMRMHDGAFVRWKPLSKKAEDQTPEVGTNGDMTYVLPV